MIIWIASISFILGALVMLVCIGIVNGNTQEDHYESLKQAYRKGYDKGLKENGGIQYALGYQDGRESRSNYSEDPEFTEEEKEYLRKEFENAEE